MFTPKHFRNDQLASLHDLMESTALATLVVVDENARPEASHVPCLLDRETGQYGTLRFHLAGANPLTELLVNKRSALAIFLGAQSYISPDWYANEQLVPTWNYQSVHAYGTVNRLTDDELMTLLADLSAQHETRLPKKPWTTDKLEPALYGKMRKVIVGYAFSIDDLQGQWKLSQNRSQEDRHGVYENLLAIGGDNQRTVASAMVTKTK